MKGWRGSRQGGDSASSPVAVERCLTSSSSIRLGRVQPQAPGHRTVFCNDRDANHLAKYKLLSSLVNLNLAENPVAEKDTVTKKIKKLVPGLADIQLKTNR